MADRSEIVEAALDVYPEALVLLDHAQCVVFWNRTAERALGYPCARMLGRPLPAALEALVDLPFPSWDQEAQAISGMTERTIVHAGHLRGTDVKLVVRRSALRDGFGRRIGTALAFRPLNPKTARPDAEARNAVLEEGSDTGRERAKRLEMRDGLELAFDAMQRAGVLPGLLLISVDQAEALRKTHGERACTEMLEVVRRSLANGLIPGNELGRWSEDQFLVLSHCHDHQNLIDEAGTMLGLVRTTDFRWWGDRIPVTVSIGATQTECGATMEEALDQARAAMEASVRSGGNRVSGVGGRGACTRSSAY